MIYAKVDEVGQKALLQEMDQTRDKKRYRRLKIVDLSGQGFTVPTLAQILT